MRVGPLVSGGGSIFNQPVHIATPAPSPPPSPAGAGGKGGKKQNYQTNQNFPFLYPSLDNMTGGRENVEPNSKLVGKRWESSDVPASILEAGHLFASRMRMSRSIRQLWDVREKFIKHDRGWNDSDEEKDYSKSWMPGVDVNEEEIISDDEMPVNELEKEIEVKNEPLQRRLDAVEKFYVRLKSVRFFQTTYFLSSEIHYLIFSPLLLFFGRSFLRLSPI